MRRERRRLATRGQSKGDRDDDQPWRRKGQPAWRLAERNDVVTLAQACSAMPNEEPSTDWIDLA